MQERMFAPGTAMDQANRELDRLRIALAQARREIANLRTLAECDSLTGLANRHRLMAEIDTMMNHLHLHQQPSVLAFIDMNRLKFLNDHFGHAVGDLAVIHIAQLIRESLPQGFAARLGGDEFALIFPNTTEADAASYMDAIAHHIMETPLCFDGDRHHLSISYGVTAFGQDDTARDLLTRADAAMYANKRQTKDFQAARSAR